MQSFEIESIPKKLNLILFKKGVVEEYNDPYGDGFTGNEIRAIRRKMSPTDKKLANYIDKIAAKGKKEKPKPASVPDLQLDLEDKIKATIISESGLGIFNS